MLHWTHKNDSIYSEWTEIVMFWKELCVCELLKSGRKMAVMRICMSSAEPMFNHSILPSSNSLSLSLSPHRDFNLLAAKKIFRLNWIYLKWVANEAQFGSCCILFPPPTYCSSNGLQLFHLACMRTKQMSVLYAASLWDRERGKFIWCNLTEKGEKKFFFTWSIQSVNQSVNRS